MDKTKFSSVEELSEHIIETLKYIRDDYPVISVFGKYEVVKDVLESLIASGVKIGKSIELEDSDVTGYDKEFELLLTEDCVCVDKMWHEDNEYHNAGYYNTDANIAFVHEDCNSKILSHICADDIYEFAIGEECTCSECKCGRNIYSDNIKINGSNIKINVSDNSYSCHVKDDDKNLEIKNCEPIYKVNGKKVDKKTYDESVKYTLESFCEILDEMEEFMDEMNEWKRLLSW